MNNRINNKIVIITSEEYCTSNQYYTIIDIHPKTIKILKKLNYSICDVGYLLQTKSYNCAVCLEYLITTHTRLYRYYNRNVRYKPLDNSVWSDIFYENYLSQKILKTYEDTIGSNIITEYILFNMFNFNILSFNYDYFTYNIIFREFFDSNNCHYTELKPHINNIVEYMKKCAINYKNKILPDNIKFTVNILEGIKKIILEYYRNLIYRNLHSIAKFNFLFYEIEKNLFPH